jgi:stress response protein SCP2
MAINLEKGQRISLEKEVPGLTKVMCGLGWDVAEAKKGFLSMFSGTKDFDLDASVLCLNGRGKVAGQKDVIYYGNLSHTSGGITHLGDNLTGAGAGDDEQVLVDLAKVPSTIQKLVFVVNIYDAYGRKQDFSQVRNAFVRLVNLDGNREIARYRLSDGDYHGQTSMIMAELFRDDQGKWQMEAIGQGYHVQNLQELVGKYS